MSRSAVSNKNLGRSKVVCKRIVGHVAVVCFIKVSPRRAMYSMLKRISAAGFQDEGMLPLVASVCQEDKTSITSMASPGQC